MKSEIGHKSRRRQRGGPSSPPDPLSGPDFPYYKKI